MSGQWNYRDTTLERLTSRRGFLHSTTALATVAAIGLSPRRTAAAPQAVIRDLQVISKNPALYHGWPTLSRRQNGQLVLVFSGGRERHVCPFGRVEMMRSDDDGLTWTWPRVLVDSPTDDRDAGVLETAKGTLLVSTFTSLAYEQRLEKELEKKANNAEDAWTDEHLQDWQAVHNRISAPERQSEVGMWMIRSTDGGVTWSARYPVMVDSPHGPIQLADGRLLYAGKKLWEPNRPTAICESLDDGQSWTQIATLPTRAGDSDEAYHELHVVETNEGKLVLHIRNHNEKNDRETLQTESTDSGKSWTTPHSIGVWGNPSHLTKLRDGRLLMTYGYRREPYGNQARVSDDGGETWSDPIVLSNDGAGFDLGYPSTVQCNDGSLLTVWYEKMANSFKAVLRQAQWSIEG